MGQEKTVQSKIGGYISTLLRDHFGKGPTSVYVSIAPPFVTIHLRGFLGSTEKILINQNESRKVLEIRDLLMVDLRQSIKMELYKLVDLPVKKLYADWNLDKNTGMLIGVLENDTEIVNSKTPDHVNHDALIEQINLASKRAQKEPINTQIAWLNDRTLLTRREGIFVEIEKELIKNGFIEELKLAKRPLEKRLIEQANLDKILKQNVEEIFADWDFEDDLGYMVLMLEKKGKKE
ncbi:DUF2294 domain-containing protein [Jeotgalibacillus proteolyticus]|uniref:Na+-translocating membrane potential-generating system MpsC domain-containing protein n=1 Tax=Jeotgalibacillus proteolyticus TaxID=2082395 RepID=A0A2S5GD70_9BACL|nr:Na-translocating system protein MpsC family protein [Jeotgalibacillus proteolyticus]PPA70861.1 hypothetical protein C4B60_08720 [Jeotgalibacillus proteolyticus]